MSDMTKLAKGTAAREHFLQQMTRSDWERVVAAEICAALDARDAELARLRARLEEHQSENQSLHQVYEANLQLHRRLAALTALVGQMEGALMQIETCEYCENDETCEWHPTRPNEDRNRAAKDARQALAALDEAREKGDLR